MPQLLKPMCPRACALQQEKPHNEKTAHSSKRAAPVCNNEDPAQPKINRLFFFFKECLPKEVMFR